MKGYDITLDKVTTRVNVTGGVTNADQASYFHFMSDHSILTNSITGTNEIPFTVSSNGANDGNSQITHFYVKGASFNQADFSHNPIRPLGVKTIANNTPNYDVMCYPNPANGSATISVKMIEASEFELNVYSTVGQLIQSMKINGQVGQNNVNLDLTKLSSGVYIFYKLELFTNSSTSPDYHYILVWQNSKKALNLLHFNTKLSKFVTHSMIETLISSKTRIKLLLKFFLNSKTTAYLRNLEEEFGESTNGIRLELNKFEKAGFLNSHNEGNKKVFKANTKHPLFRDIHSIVLKLVGLDHVVDYIIQRIGDLHQVYLVGKLANGQNSDVIDLVLVGTDLNKTFLLEQIEKAEKKIGKKIRYISYMADEFDLNKIKEPDMHPLLIWSK
jgi:hypothetical protein